MPSNNIVNVNIVEWKKIQTLDGQKEIVTMGYPHLKKLLKSQ